MKKKKHYETARLSLYDVYLVFGTSNLQFWLDIIYLFIFRIIVLGKIYILYKDFIQNKNNHPGNPHLTFAL